MRRIGVVCGLGPEVQHEVLEIPALLINKNSVSQVKPIWPVLFCFGPLGGFHFCVRARTCGGGWPADVSLKWRDRGCSVLPLDTT